MVVSLVLFAVAAVAGSMGLPFYCVRVVSDTAAEELPLVHTTRCEILPYIVATHELRSVTPCDVFHEQHASPLFGLHGRRNLSDVLGESQRR